MDPIESKFASSDGRIEICPICGCTKANSYGVDCKRAASPQDFSYEVAHTRGHATLAIEIIQKEEGQKIAGI